jgi:hypothetical protein
MLNCSSKSLTLIRKSSLILKGGRNEREENIISKSDSRMRITYQPTSSEAV